MDIGQWRRARQRVRVDRECAREEARVESEPLMGRLEWEEQVA